MTKLRFGIVGQYQSGKSLLINCLLNRHVATVGVGAATTHTVVNYSFSESEFAEIVYDRGTKETCDISRLEGIDTDKTIKTVNVFLNNGFLRDYTLTDMPGFGFNETDNKVALEALGELDYAIVVVSNEKSFGTDSPQYRDFCLLQRYNIPYYLVLNCKDIVKDGCWHPYHDININRMLEDLHIVDFYKPICYPFKEGHIPIVNLMWYWYVIQEHDDEILKRREIFNAIKVYDLPSYSPSEIMEASNFNLIQKIFDVDNRAYLELKKEFKEELSKLKEELCPVGTIQAFAYNRIPKGWMICDGSKLDPTVHHVLFNAIGTTFGGDGENYFRLPDLRGRFIRGWSSNGKIDAERKFGSYQEDTIINHTHLFSMEDNKTKKDGSHDHAIGYDKKSFLAGYKDCYSVADHSDPFVRSWGDSTRAIHQHELPEMKVGNVRDIDPLKIANENRPNNIALLYCIKADPLVEGGIIPENDFLLVTDQNDEPEMPCNSELNYKEIISRL